MLTRWDSTVPRAHGSISFGRPMRPLCPAAKMVIPSFTLLTHPTHLTDLTAQTPLCHDFDPVFFKSLIACHYGQIECLRGCDDKSIAGIIVERRELGGCNASL